MISDLQKRLFTGSLKNVMESFFKIKSIKILKEVMNSFFNVKNFKSSKEMMDPFSVL